VKLIILNFSYDFFLQRKIVFHVNFCILM